MSAIARWWKEKWLPLFKRRKFSTGARVAWILYFVLLNTALIAFIRDSALKSQARIM
jgi:hypothetical protein